MDRIVREFETLLKRLVSDEKEKLWEKREADVRHERRIRALMSAPRYTVIGTIVREELFGKVYAEQRKNHQNIDCGKEPVVAGR